MLFASPILFILHGFCVRAIIMTN